MNPFTIEVQTNFLLEFELQGSQNEFSWDVSSTENNTENTFRGSVYVVLVYVKKKFWLFSSCGEWSQEGGENSLWGMYNWANV